MKIINNVYKFSVFGNFTEIQNTPENVYELIDLFKEDKLIPSTFEEVPPINIQNLQIVNMQLPVITRPILNSFDKKRSVVLGTSRLDFVINDETKYNNFKINTNVQKNCAKIYANKIFKKYNLHSNRLALNSQIIIDDLTESDSSSFYQKLINTIPFYSDAYLKEWNLRLSTRKSCTLNSVKEELNVIVIIRQNTIPFINDAKQKEKNIISINFDINTSQEQISQRFNEDYIESFLCEASTIANQILSEIESVING